MKRSRPWLLVTAALVVMVVVSLWFSPMLIQGHQEHQESVEAGTSEAQIGATFSQSTHYPVVVEGAPERAGTPDSAPLILPVWSEPLSQQIDALLAAVERGSSEASCRLVLAVNKCSEVSRGQEMTKRMLARLQASSSRHEDAMIRSVALSQEQLDGSSGFCSDFNRDSIPGIESALEKAIFSLTPRQQTLLVMTRSDGRLRRLSFSGSFSESSFYILPQYISDWTLPSLQNGLARFDPLALEGMIMLHAPALAVRSQGIRVALPNAKLFVQYATLAERLFGSEFLGDAPHRLVIETRSVLAPTDREQIEAWVSAELVRWQSGMGEGVGHAAHPPSAETDEAASMCEER